MQTIRGALCGQRLAIRTAHWRMRVQSQPMTLPGCARPRIDQQRELRRHSSSTGSVARRGARAVASSWLPGRRSKIVRDVSAPVQPDDRLIDLVRRDGPFLTVWAARPTGSRHHSRSYTAAIRDAAGNLMPRHVVDELADTVEAALPAGAGFVAVADRRGVQLSELLPEAPRNDLVRLHALPSLSPVIQHRQSGVPFITVLADRLGADLVFSDGRLSRSETVHAAHGPSTHGSGSGWSQRRYHRLAENTWEQTARDIAAELEKLIARIEPRVVTVAGDARVVHLVRSQLSKRSDELVRHVPGGRSEDGSEEDRDGAVRRWIRSAVAEETVEILRIFQQERGQNDRASDGPAATFTALREGRVDTLLVHDESEDVRPAWFVPDNPLLVGDDVHVLAQLGYPMPHDGRLIDVAIRSALCSSATVRVVPASGLNGAIGAILRW
jgi:hypothetical protein